MAAVTLRLFAAAREAAGASTVAIEGTTLAGVLGTATERFGPSFAGVLANSRVWINGDEPSSPEAVLTDGDEVAVLPPVSGGATDSW